VHTLAAVGALEKALREQDPLAAETVLQPLVQLEAVEQLTQEAAVAVVGDLAALVADPAVQVLLLFATLAHNAVLAEQ
jgi:hypothetical protein